MRTPLLELQIRSERVAILTEKFPQHQQCVQNLFLDITLVVLFHTWKMSSQKSSSSANGCFSYKECKLFMLEKSLYWSSIDPENCFGWITNLFQSLLVNWN